MKWTISSKRKKNQLGSPTLLPDSIKCIFFLNLSVCLTNDDHATVVLGWVDVVAFTSLSQLSLFQWWKCHCPRHILRKYPDELLRVLELLFCSQSLMLSAFCCCCSLKPSLAKCVVSVAVPVYLCPFFCPPRQHFYLLLHLPSSLLLLLFRFLTPSCWDLSWSFYYLLEFCTSLPSVSWMGIGFWVLLFTIHNSLYVQNTHTYTHT